MDKSRTPYCPRCGADAIRRQGKHGPFYCCPNSRPGDNHGTLSAADVEAQRAVSALANIATGYQFSEENAKREIIGQTLNTVPAEPFSAEGMADYDLRNPDTAHEAWLDIIPRG